MKEFGLGTVFLQKSTHVLIKILSKILDREKQAYPTEVTRQKLP
jgi:hypothetical protein